MRKSTALASLTAILAFAAAAPALASDWELHDVTDHLRGKIGIGMTANGFMHNRYGRFPAALVVNCSDNSTTVFILSDNLNVFGDSAVVEYTLDGGTVHKATWNVCQANNCVGLWHGAGIPFAKSLLGKGLLRTVIHRAYGEEIDADFAIADGAASMRYVGLECGWMPK
jgi:hypothetical protein